MVFRRRLVEAVGNVLDDIKANGDGQRKAELRIIIHKRHSDGLVTAGD